MKKILCSVLVTLIIASCSEKSKTANSSKFGTPTKIETNKIAITKKKPKPPIVFKQYKAKPLPVMPKRGSVLVESWINISGNDIQTLYKDKNYATNPHSVLFVDDFTFSGLGDNYGSRTSALLCPKVSGSYTFWIASDDMGELFLSTDTTSENLKKIAVVAGWTSANDWDKAPAQKSSSIELKAGVKYLIVATHKEGGGGDHISVAWQGPNFKRKLIASEFLEPITSPQSIALKKYNELHKLRHHTATMKALLPALTRVTNEDGLDLYKLRIMTKHMSNRQDLESKLDVVEKEVLNIRSRHIKGEQLQTNELAKVNHKIQVLAAEISSQYGWPFYRGNISQNPISYSDLAEKLYCQWIHAPTHKPSPAWPAPAKINYSANSSLLDPTLTYDRAYHASISNGKLYYGSSTDHTVNCLNTETGEHEWFFTTQAPVRLAPVHWDSKIYAGSDDGYLYCLDAESGKLIWKYAAFEKDVRLPGNGQMISKWPLRCGIVISDGTVYFAAGLFPQQGVYLCAVNAQTGKKVWQMNITNSPQGHMALSPSRIFLPTGRTPFAMFARDDGRPLGGLGRSTSWGLDLHGGASALIMKNHIATGPTEDGQVHLYDIERRETILRTKGIQVIDEGASVLVLAKNQLTAFEKNTLFTKGNSKRQELWSVSCPNALTMLTTATKVIVGQNGMLTIYDLESGKSVWQQKIEGRAEGLALAAQELFVSTDTGKIYCFGAENVAKAQVTSALSPKVTPSSLEHSSFAKKLVKQSGFEKGYCLVLNAGTGELCYQLAKNSKLKIIGIENDSGKRQQAITMLRAHNLYGTRVVIQQISGDTLPFRQYLFNIVTSGTLDNLKVSPKELTRVLRPNGGLLVLSGESSGATKNLMRSFGNSIPTWIVTQNGKVITGMSKRGALKGAGEWNNYYGDSGNTACSNDQLAYGEMGLQWFGRPGPRRMADRHLKSPPPIYANGYMYVTGQDYIAGLDAYNGTVLWESSLKDSGRVATMRDCGNMAASGNKLYVAHGAHCSVIDSQSGATVQKMNVSDKKEWGYIAVVGDTLIGSEGDSDTQFRAVDAAASRANHNSLYNKVTFHGNGPFACSEVIFANSAVTGARLWTYPSKGLIVNPAIACTKKLVLFVECQSPEIKKSGTRVDHKLFFANPKNKLVALDRKTGKAKWSTSIDIKKFQWSLFLLATEDKVVVAGSRYAKIDNRLKNRYDMLAFDTASGALKWSSTETPSPDTGNDHGKVNQHPVIVGDVIYGTGYGRHLSTGKPYTGWKWVKSGKCGTFAASANCGFSRFSNPRMFDLKTGKYMQLTTVSRPGCWINIIPAGGMVLIPEASSGCTCGYSIQTSMAFSPAE